MRYENMGQLISEHRKEQNMTQQDLAAHLNVTDKAVSKWERGISYPDIRTIPRLAEILNVSTEELLTLQKNLPEAENPNDDEKFRNIFSLILKAVAMAMGVAVLVLSIIKEIDADSAITLLAIGLTCAGISLLQNNSK